MRKTFQNLFSLFFILNLILAGVIFVNGQAAPPPPPVPRRIAPQSQIPGATVRGRVVFEDSGLPVRHTYVGLMSAKSIGSYGASTFTKTDENGDFILKDVKAGDYYPVIRNKSVINPDKIKMLNNFDPDSPRVEDVFRSISVSGQGSFQTFISAKRGSDITGTVRFFDGEVAANVEVEILRKLDDQFLEYPGGKATTDDRGFYRVSGLPEGVYKVRVTEPVPHKSQQTTYISSYSFGNKSELLRTFYPNVKRSKDANEIQLYAGQEQDSVDVTLPPRELFDISGKVILKSDGSSLKGFSIKFQPIIDEEDQDDDLIKVASYYGSGGTTVETNDSGEWTMQNLPSGKYNVIASQTSVYDSSDNKGNKKYPTVVKEIEIDGNDLDNVTVEVTEGGTIKGILVSESGGKFSAYLRVMATNSQTNTRILSDLDVSKIKDRNAQFTQMPFTISRLSGGKVKLDITSRDHYIRSISVGSRSVGTDGEFEIEPGETIENVRIVMASDLGVVKGRVDGIEQNDGRVAVFLFKEGIDLSTPTIDGLYVGFAGPNGEFSVRAKPGRYKVIAVGQSNFQLSREASLSFFGNLLSSASSVSVEKNGTSNINVGLSR